MSKARLRRRLLRARREDWRIQMLGQHPLAVTLSPALNELATRYRGRQWFPGPDPNTERRYASLLDRYEIDEVGTMPWRGRSR